MFTDLKASSLSDNFKELSQAVKKMKYRDRISFCTDDVHVADLLSLGHMNHLVRRARECGIDSIDAIIKLKTAHEKEKKGPYFGLDLDSGEAVDMIKMNVVEPLRVKVQAINSAAEVANMILRIDDVIASRRAPPMNPMADPNLGGPGMSGIGGMM